MHLIERDEQLSDLSELLTAGAGGNGRVVLVDGPATSGRTELLRAAAGQATDLGYRLLNATCSREEQVLNLGVISQFVHGVDLPREFVQRAEKLLADGYHAEQDSAELMRVCHSLSVVLLDLAGSGPLLIGIDDLRYADPASLQCLRCLIRRLDSTRIVLVMTDDVVQYDGPRLSYCAELLRLPQLTRLQVAPLSEDGVTTLLTERFDEDTARALVTDCYAASGGNPLLATAFMDDHAAAGEVRHQGYGLAMLSCLHREDPLLLDTVRGLAVLGHEASAEDIATLIGTDTASVDRTLTALETSALLDKGRFRHPVALAAVLDDLPEPQRLALHRKAADLLHTRGATGIEVARHLLAGGRLDAVWAGPLLRDAAEQALLDDDMDLAVRCLDVAFGVCVGERDRVAIRVRLAQVEAQLRPRAAVRHLSPLVASARRGLVTSQDICALIRQLLWHGRTDEAGELLGQRRSSAEAASDAELRDVESWLRCVHPTLARRVGGGTSVSRLPGADPWLRSAAALAELVARGNILATTARAEQVLRDLSLSRITPWAEECALLGLLALVYGDRLESAANWSDRLLAQATDLPVATALCTAVKAEIALRQGDLAAAVSLAQEALDALPTKAWGVAIGLPLGCLVLAATRSGDYETAAYLLAKPVPAGMLDSRWGLHYQYARGQYYLATHHHHAALADFRSCGELMRGWSLDSAGIVPWRTSAAEAWLRLGNQDQARLLLSDQLARPGVDGSRVRGSSLRLLAAISAPATRLQLLAEALDIFESCGDRYEQARVLADFSRAYNLLDQKRRARLLFRQAVHVANVCGAKPLYHELLQISGETSTTAEDATSARINSLTSSERRVASLAVMGYTNREIAAKLFVTPSTVEQHMTRIFRKLAVKTRGELPVHLWAERSKVG